jgi:hypothetical protein
MEQQLDATYLRHDPIERAAAIAVAAGGIGLGVLLAAWGISFLWRYTPPEIAVRIANPEVRVKQDAPLAVAQDKPFVIAQPGPLKIDPGQVTIKVEQSQQPAIKGVVDSDSQTGSGDVIRREVTVFSFVRHGPGAVVTGWNYKDGSGGVPVSQFCYYSAPDIDHSSKRIDIAADRIPRSDFNPDLVPELEGARTKCQWSQG